MPNLSQVELNSIREMVACHQTVAAKLTDYAGQSQDPKIKQMFQQAAGDAAKGAKNLLTWL